MLQAFRVGNGAIKERMGAGFCGTTAAWLAA
jgi:hypothetical protein